MGLDKEKEHIWKWDSNYKKQGFGKMSETSLDGVYRIEKAGAKNIERKQKHKRKNNNCRYPTLPFIRCIYL